MLVLKPREMGQIHGLPIGKQTRNMAVFSVQKAGIVLDVDFKSNLHVWRTSYLRCRVMVDLTNPLVPGYYFERPVGDHLWIQFKYEHIADLCFSCGRLGHSQTFCSYGVGEVIGPHGFRALMKAEIVEHRRFFGTADQSNVYLSPHSSPRNSEQSGTARGHPAGSKDSHGRS